MLFSMYFVWSMLLCSRETLWTIFPFIPFTTPKCLLLRGAIVNRTYGIHKNLYV